VLYNKEGKGKGFPLQAWSVSCGFRRLSLLDLLDFRHYEGGKVVTLTHRPPSPPGACLVLIFRGWVDRRAHGSVGSVGKNSPATPLGIDPDTFQLVAQCLNHYPTPGPNKEGTPSLHKNLKYSFSDNYPVEESDWYFSSNWFVNARIYLWRSLCLCDI
jgi:hypothetical protein